MKNGFSIKNTTRKSYTAFRNSLSQILLFEILCKAVTAIVVVPLLAGILNLALRAGRRGFVANSEIVSFLFSPIGILAAVLLLALSVLFVYIEFSVLITLIYHGYRGEKVKLRHAVRLSLSGIRGLFTVQTLGFGVYALVILPLANMGVVSTLLPNLNIPNFVVSSLAQTLWGALLLLMFSLFLLVAGAMLSYALPAMILERIPFREAVAKSRMAMKKTVLKRFLMELLFVAVWVLLLMIPLVVLGYIIDVKGFLMPNTVDVFTTFGIAWRAFVCLLAVGGIWILQTLFMPMMLAIITVTYLELNGAPAVALDQQHPVSGIHKRYRRIMMPVLMAFAVLFASNMINTISDFLIWPAPLADPVVMGHRGSLEGVENTLEAIQGAIDAGADYAEIDVQLSKDGVPVVVHDASLDRLSGQKQAIYNLTAAELTQIPLEQNGVQGYIPTLEQVVQYSRGYIKLNIELKLHGYESEDLLEKVMEVIEKEDFLEHCVFQSLSYELVQRMKEAYPQYRVGYIVYGNLGSPTPLGIQQLDIDFLAVEEAFATQRLMLACRKAGIPLYVWTVNDEEELRRFWEMGVDGIITDRPDSARSQLE